MQGSTAKAQKQEKVLLEPTTKISDLLAESNLCLCYRSLRPVSLGMEQDKRFSVTLRVGLSDTLWRASDTDNPILSHIKEIQCDASWLAADTDSSPSDGKFCQ